MTRLSHLDKDFTVFMAEIWLLNSFAIQLETWDVRSQYRAGSLTAAARELTRYKLDSVGCAGG